MLSFVKPILRALPVLVTLALLLPAQGAQAATPGINLAGPPTPDLVQQAIESGAKTARIFVLWRDFEPDRRDQFPPVQGRDSQGLIDLTRTFDEGLKSLNAAGIKPIFVIVESPQWASGSADVFAPPANPADFASFAGRFAKRNKDLGGQVRGYEIWNEADADTYWHPAPSPAHYAAMLKQSYSAIKAVDPAATVVASPTTGNNADWYQTLYEMGAGGSFDAAAVHTDTACLITGPDQFYRDDRDRLAQFAFLGYRTVHDVMAANGDENKPIWMTELGWSSTNGGPASCSRGVWAGKKADGVNETQQAMFMAKAYQCVANDSYLTDALWFTLRDSTTNTPAEMNHYGLLRTDGSPKPAWTAFRNIAAANGGEAADCGDFTPPAIKVIKPTPNEQFVGTIDISSTAADTGVGMFRVAYTYDGGKPIRNFEASAGIDFGQQLRQAPWYTAKSLPPGPHTIEITATDANGNRSTTTVPIVKVTTLASTLTPKIKLGKVKCSKKRICKLRGSLSRGKAGTPSIAGKVGVEWQFRNKKGKWRKLVGGLKPAQKPFTFKTKRLKFKGRWRVRVVYQGLAPWKKTPSKFLYFKIRR